jgi:hypothetical protein
MQRNLKANEVSLLVAALICMMLVQGFAQQQSVNNAPTPPVRPASANGVEQELRDPFLPPNYEIKAVSTFQPASSNSSSSVAVQPTVNPTGPSWPELKRPKSFVKTPKTIMVQFEGIPGMVEAGQTVQMEKDGYVYRWKIESIAEKVSSLEMSIIRLDYTPAGSK